MAGTKTNERPGTRAKASYVRSSAYKAREVLDLIRGKSYAEAAEILTAATRGDVDSTAVMGLYTSARRVVSKEALAPPTQVDFTPDGF